MYLKCKSKILKPEIMKQTWINESTDLIVCRIWFRCVEGSVADTMTLTLSDNDCGIQFMSSFLNCMERKQNNNDAWWYYSVNGIIITRSMPSIISHTGRFVPIDPKRRLICSEYDCTFWKQRYKQTKGNAIFWIKTHMSEPSRFAAFQKVQLNGQWVKHLF